MVSHGIRNQDFDIEHQKDHGDEVEADIKALLGVADGVHAGFVGRFFGLADPLRSERRGERDVESGKARRDHKQDPQSRPLAILRNRQRHYSKHQLHPKNHTIDRTGRLYSPAPPRQPDARRSGKSISSQDQNALVAGARAHLPPSPAPIQWQTCGRSSVVERHVPNVHVEGSIPFARYIHFKI